jgi:hypothetical protein
MDEISAADSAVDTVAAEDPDSNDLKAYNNFKTDLPIQNRKVVVLFLKKLK